MTEDLKSGKWEIVMTIFMAFSHSSADSQVTLKPCSFGQMCMYVIVTSKIKGSPSCPSVLFSCPPPINHVSGGQMAGSRGLPRKAKMS